MHIAADTLDDLLRAVFGKLLKIRTRVKPTKGLNSELIGVVLELRRPRARLSRTDTKGTVFSCLGETLWYLSRGNDLSFIQYYLGAKYAKYSDDGKTIYGGYGPRLFAARGDINQIANITKLLSKKSATRQAVIQIFDARDIIEKHNDVPCTCTLQFLLRNGRLNLLTHMRSNDAFLGLPHDVFAFTFIQELVARSLGVELGIYRHFVGSLHLYETDRPKARAFLKEGWQPTTTMPPMPAGDQWRNVERILQLEPLARSEVTLDLAVLPGYWADLARLLQVFGQTGRKRAIAKLKSEMTTRIYDAYIDKRAGMRRTRN